MRIGRGGIVRVAAAAMLAATAAGLAASSVMAVSAATVNVREVSDRYQFNPGTTSVTVGGTVTWSNGTDAPHTVTSDSGGTLASGTIAPGGTFTHTFTSTGTFTYHCSVHPYMTGSIVVLAANATPPGTDTASGSSTGSGPLPALELLVLSLGAILGLAIIVLRVRPAR